MRWCRSNSAGHLAALAEPPEQVSDLVSRMPEFAVGRIPALLAHDAIGQLCRVDAVP